MTCPPCNQNCNEGRNCPAQNKNKIIEEDDIQEYIKPWVGLTNEEVELYWDWEDFQCGCGPSTLFAMVRDIEARLKDRNI